MLALGATVSAHRNSYPGEIVDRDLGGRQIRVVANKMTDASKPSIWLTRKR